MRGGKKKNQALPNIADTDRYGCCNTNTREKFSNDM